jgi:hypothetical protein
MTENERIILTLKSIGILGKKGVKKVCEIFQL